MLKNIVGNLEEIKLAFKGHKRQLDGIAQNEGIHSFFVPLPVMSVARFEGAVDQVCAANGSACRQMVRHVKAKLFLERFAKNFQALWFQRGGFCGVNKNVTAKTCTPRTVFNCFVAIHNQPCPRLSNAKCFHAYSLAESDSGCQ